MSDLDRLKRLAQDGDLDAARELVRVARRLNDADLVFEAMNIIESARSALDARVTELLFFAISSSLDGLVAQSDLASRGFRKAQYELESFDEQYMPPPVKTGD